MDEAEATRLAAPGPAHCPCGCSERLAKLERDMEAAIGMVTFLRKRIGSLDAAFRAFLGEAKNAIEKRRRRVVLPGDPGFPVHGPGDGQGGR